MEPFATAEDYRARFDDVIADERLDTLLADASAYIAAQPGFELRDDDVQAANLVRVTCAVVHRSISAGDLAGVQTYTQTGIGYSASVTPSNPGEDFYLNKAERKTLGIGGFSFGAILPEIGRGAHADA